MSDNKEQKVNKTRITAAEYLKSKGLKNPPIGPTVGGGGDVKIIRPSDLMDEWSDLNGKFRDKALMVSQSENTALKLEVGKLQRAMESIKVISKKKPHFPNTRVCMINDIAEQALKP